MTHIDFIGIGAPKCGTTWLSAQLEAHPQIGFAPDKEVYYFADTILRRIAGQELHCFESPARSCTALAEVSPGITNNFRPPGERFPAAESFVPLTSTWRKRPPGSPLTGAISSSWSACGLRLRWFIPGIGTTETPLWLLCLNRLRR